MAACALPTWPYSSAWGYYPAGGLGTVLLVLLILIVLGLLGAKTWLEPHEHPVRFILFWFACAWITLTALLLGLLDLLLLRAQARRARRALREEAATDIKSRD